MVVGLRDVGNRQTLMKRVKKLLASAAIVAALSVAAGWSIGTPSIAAVETRTISLYYPNTKERLTVTYKVNGRYVPSAMKQLNYFLRDWRRNEVIAIDPKMIDLVWELHADLGSKAPVNIVSGYRSAATNGFLKRVGRNVADKSQHIKGKAIDIFFSDVPTVKIRNSALVRKMGGVGFYPTSGPRGFVHLDSGRVRTWGPAISRTEMAQIFRDGRKTVGARLNRKDSIAVASANADAAAIALEAAYEGVDEDLATLSEQASKSPVAKPVRDIPKETVQDYPTPKPRPKPLEILVMAAASMDISDLNIEPTSAPPPTQEHKSRPSVIAGNLGVVEAAETLLEQQTLAQMSNASTKGSFADAVRDGTAEGVPLIKPQMASFDDINWWPAQTVSDPEQAVRRDGAPQEITTNENSLLPSAQAQPVSTASASRQRPIVVAQNSALPFDKDDVLVVNRSGKGNLPENLRLDQPGFQEIGQLETD